MCDPCVGMPLLKFGLADNFDLALEPWTDFRQLFLKTHFAGKPLLFDISGSIANFVV